MIEVICKYWNHKYLNVNEQLSFCQFMKIDISENKWKYQSSLMFVSLTLNNGKVYVTVHSHLNFYHYKRKKSFQNLIIIYLYLYLYNNYYFDFWLLLSLILIEIQVTVDRLSYQICQLPTKRCKFSFITAVSFTIKMAAMIKLQYSW